MKRATLLTMIFAIILCTVNIECTFAQATNPVPQTIPYLQDFSSLTHLSSAYPAGWQGWVIGSSSGSTFKTNAPSADAPLNISSTAATTDGGVQNYNGKLGILSTTAADAALCLALNTTGLYRVLVTSNVTSTIRNPYDGSGNTRINEFTLQYRVGTSGSFTTLGTSYLNNTINQTAAVTTPQNTQSRSWLLPPAADNQPEVQVRWVQRDNTGSGLRPGFAVDNVSVCSASFTPGVSIGILTGANPLCSGTAVTFAATPVNGGTAQYQWKINGGNVGTNSSQFSSNSLTDGEIVSCQMTSLATCLNAPPIVSSNSITMSVSSSTFSQAPALTIQGDNTGSVCANSVVTFNAILTDGGANPIYQWKKNNVNVGANSSIYIDSVWSPDDTVKCIFTASDPCVLSASAFSNEEILTVRELVQAPQSILADHNPVCINGTAYLKPVGGYLGNSGNWFWYQDDCDNGIFLGNDDSIAVSPTSNATYYIKAAGSCNTSNCISINLSVMNPVNASVSISSSPANAQLVCQGTILTYTASPINGGSNPVYQWIKHPNTIVGTNSNIYIDSTLIPGSSNLFCNMTSNAYCLTGQNPVISNGKGLGVLENPTLPTGIDVSNTSICAGESVTLHRIGGNPGSGIIAWYVGGCGNILNGGSGGFLAGGDSVVVTPSNTQTYYLGAEGLCPLSTCQSVTIIVNHPGAIEICGNNIDENCNGMSDDICNTSASLNLKLLFEGFYTGGGTMIASINPVDFPDICDTVIVELHLPVPPFNLVHTNKNVISTLGNGSFDFPGTLNQSYYVVVKHRNGIETWSANPVLFSPVTSYDFTTAISKAYGNNMTPTYDNMGWAFYSGDISEPNLGVGYQDGIIESQDYSDMENAVSLILAGYIPEDITGDGIIESADYSLMENNVFFTIVSMRP